MDPQTHRAAWSHIQPDFTSIISNSFVIDFNLFSLKLSDCISTPWMYGSRGAQCKAGVSYVLFLNSLNLFAGKDVVLEKRFKNRQWGQNRWVLKPRTFEIAKLKFG